MGRANSKGRMLPAPPRISLVQMLSRIPTQWIILLSSHWPELSHMSCSPTGNWGKWVFKLTPCCNEYVDGMRPIGQVTCVGASITCMPPGHTFSHSRLEAVFPFRVILSPRTVSHGKWKRFYTSLWASGQEKAKQLLLLLLSRFSRVRLCATP